MGVANGRRRAMPKVFPTPSVTARWLYEKLQGPTDLRPGKRVQNVPFDAIPSEVAGNAELPALRRYYRLPNKPTGDKRTDARYARQMEEASMELPFTRYRHADKTLITRQMTKAEEMSALWQACKKMEREDGRVRVVRWEKEFRVEVLDYVESAPSFSGYDVFDD